MIRSIALSGKTYPYSVTYKRMKTIRLKVRAGQIEVSAPYGTSVSWIETLLRQNSQKLIAQIEAYRPLMVCEDQGYCFLFGRRYQLKVIPAGQRTCVIHDEQIYIYSGASEATLRHFLKEQLYGYLEQRISDYVRTDFHRTMPEIQIRKYKGRWGSCYYEQNRVIFNEELAHLDPLLIDYVIVHELCHFIEANHSPRFWQEVRKRLPDYMARKNALKDVKI